MIEWAKLSHFRECVFFYDFILKISCCNGMVFKKEINRNIEEILIIEFLGGNIKHLK